MEPVQDGHRHSACPPGRRSRKAPRSLAKPGEVALQILGKRRLHVDSPAREGVVEREARGMEKLAAERGIGHAVDGVSDDRQPDRREMHAVSWCGTGGCGFS